jgi:hypothetical protein
MYSSEESRTKRGAAFQKQLSFLSQTLGIKINHPNQPYRSLNNRDLSHTTVLSIPYCNKTLRWELLYDSSTDFPPDFIFDPGNENFVQLDQVKSIKTWNLEDVKALSEIVKELLLKFKEFNFNLIRRYPSERFQFELSTIQSIPGIEFLLTAGETSSEVQCLIPFSFEEADISEALQKEPVKLSITFYPDINRIPTARLLVGSGSLWEGLQMKIPSWTTDTCTMTYIPDVKALLKPHFDSWFLRKKLVKALVDVFGRPLEFDAYSFQKVAFVFDDQTLPMLLFFSVPSTFPTKQPVVTLQSTLGLSKLDRPLQKVYDAYPYSPRWTMDELSRRIKDWLIDAIPEFKKWVNEEKTGP